MAINTETKEKFIELLIHDLCESFDECFVGEIINTFIYAPCKITEK